MGGRQSILLTSYVFYGAISIGGQVLFIRELLVVHFGSELALGIVFASWLLSISVGAWIGGRLCLLSKTPVVTYFFLLLAMAMVTPGEIVLIRMLRNILEIPTGELVPFLPMALSTFFLLFPLSFLVGLNFPFACRSLETLSADGAIRIGWIYLLEAFGSALGGALITYWMIQRFSALQIAAIFALITVACVLLATVSSPLRRRRGLLVTAVSLFSLLLFVTLGGFINTWHSWSIGFRWKGFNPRIPLVESVDSIYQNIAVGRLNEQYSIFGNGQLIETFPDEYTTETLAHFIMSQHPSPQQILLIGGGIGGLIRQILEYPIERLDYVELDPQLIEVTRRYLSHSEKEALNDPRLQMAFVDGRYFVKKSRRHYDLVFVNLPDPSTALLNRFYTIDFFQEIRRILSGNGVVALRLSSAVNYMGEAVGNYTGSIYWTLRAVYPYLLATPGDKVFYFASISPDTITSDHKVLAERFSRSGVKSSRFSPYHFEMLLPPQRVAFIQRALDARHDLPLNTDRRPITYFYNLILWNLFSAKKYQTTFFARLTPLKLWWIVLPIFFFIAARIAFLAWRRDRTKSSMAFNALFAIATTGFAGMALEIILIFSFQNLFGYIYQKIGIIISIFMIGLASGSLLMNGILKRRDFDWRIFLGILEVSICLFAFFLPQVLVLFFDKAALPLEASFYMLVAMAGLLAGFEFPLVSRILIDENLEMGSVAGKVDSFDHLGAFFGAALTGTLFVPILGTGASCILVVLIKVASILFLSIFLLYNRKCSP